MNEFIDDLIGQLVAIVLFGTPAFLWLYFNK